MSFEQELINAIQNGCPKCENEILNVTSDEVTTYRIRIIGEEKSSEIDWYDSYCHESYDSRVGCDFCGAELWTSEKGWIPELSAIVKGESQ